MLPLRLSSMLRGAVGKSAAPPPPASGRSHFARKQLVDSVSVRSSRGLEEFFASIRDQTGLTILDLGGATQENVSFITDLGHRLYSEDFLQILDETFGGEDAVDQTNPGQIEFFLRQALDYPEGQFDGVLVWSVLEYLSPPMLTAVVDRLQKIVRPKSYMLSVFHTDDKAEAMPFYTFRIQEVNALEVAQHGMRRPIQLFNNRGLEKLFGRFESVRFFLTREQLREVIIRV